MKSVCVSLAVAIVATTGCQSRSRPEQSSTPTGGIAAPGSDSSGASAFAYPATKRQDIVETVHGHRIADPYRWLEDATTPEVQRWMNAQDQVARARLAEIDQRSAMADRLRALYGMGSVSPPKHRSGRYFHERRPPGAEKAILFWRQGEAGTDRPLIDPNRMSPDGTVAVSGWSPSPDGKLVAYKRNDNNADEAILYLRDVTTGEDSKIDVIVGARYARPSWSPDSRGFYYTWLPVDPAIPTADRPGHQTIRYHAVGTDPQSDPIVFPATYDPQRFASASVSADGAHLLLSLQKGWRANDLYFRKIEPRPRAAGTEARRPASPPDVDAMARAHGFVPLAVARDAAFRAVGWGGKIYVRTNDEAPAFRVFAIDPARPDRASWREIVPETSAVLRNAQIVGGNLVLSYLRDAAAAIEIRTLAGELTHQVALPGIGRTRGLTPYRASVVGAPEDTVAYFSFESYAHPHQVMRLDIASGETSVWAGPPAQPDPPIDPERFKVTQSWFKSKDGTRVSLFVVHERDAPRDGSRPALLYGYGGFDISLSPRYRPSTIAWLERGGIYAVAHLRGGGEYGEAWHRAGMLARKQNTFDDFIAAAEHLISAGYTSADRLAIRGASNGGLLVSAAMTQRPDLFRAVVCAVPLTDMVRYHLFGSGKTWIPEYGSAEDPEQIAALHAYSPYHRVVRGTRYPATLMMTADNDDRVDPLHARKLIAALQWASSAPHPLLMRVERNAGHTGADQVRKSVEAGADMLAFLLWQLSPPAKSSNERGNP